MTSLPNDATGTGAASSPRAETVKVEGSGTQVIRSITGSITPTVRIIHPSGSLASLFGPGTTASGYTLSSESVTLIFTSTLPDGHLTTVTTAVTTETLVPNKPYHTPLTHNPGALIGIIIGVIAALLLLGILIKFARRAHRIRRLEAAALANQSRPFGLLDDGDGEDGLPGLGGDHDMAERSELSLSFATGYGSASRFSRVSDPFADPLVDVDGPDRNSFLRPASGSQASIKNASRLNLTVQQGVLIPLDPDTQPTSPVAGHSRLSRPESLVYGRPYPGPGSALNSSDQLLGSDHRASRVSFAEPIVGAPARESRTSNSHVSAVHSRLSQLKDEADSSSVNSSIRFRSGPSSVEECSPTSVRSSRSIVGPPSPVIPPPAPDPAPVLLRPGPMPLHTVLRAASANNLKSLVRPNHPGKMPDWHERTAGPEDANKAAARVSNPFATPPEPSTAGSVAATREGLLKLDGNGRCSSSNISLRDDVDYSRPIAGSIVHNRSPSGLTVKSGDTFGLDGGKGSQRGTPGSRWGTPATINEEDPFKSIFDDSSSGSSTYHTATK